MEKNRNHIFQIFKETDHYKLQLLILSSKLLNKFSEAQMFPYTSYKYHLLLTCSSYWNLKNDYSWKKLYLAENLEVDCQFQIIYCDKTHEWVILLHKGMSHVLPNFF